VIFLRSTGIGNRSANDCDTSIGSYDISEYPSWTNKGTIYLFDSQSIFVT